MAQRSRGAIFVRSRSEQCSTGNRFFLSSKFRRPTLQDRITRAGDVVIAAVLLALTLPLFALLCLAIKLDSPGPVLYRQRRLGPEGRWVSVLIFVSRSARLSGSAGSGIAHHPRHEWGVSSTTPA